jgi:hypothetical protein
MPDNPSIDLHVQDASETTWESIIADMEVEDPFGASR